MIDTITRGTSPTFKLTVQGKVPEGSISKVDVTQGDSSFSPEVEFDHASNSVSFTLPKAYTEAMTAGEYLRIQQTIVMPNGNVEEFEVHDVLVEDMLYVEPEEPEEPYSEMFYYETEDTTVQAGTSYFDYVYVPAVPIDGSSPIDMGLYDDTGSGFELSQDNSFDPEKTYYLRQIAPAEPSANDNPASLGWLVVEALEDQANDSEEFELEEDEGEPLYVAVTPSSGDNPSENGWLEVNELGEYVDTMDTSVDNSKIYYEAEEDDYMDNAEAFYEDFDEEAYASINGLECVDDEEPEEYQEQGYVQVSVSTGDNPKTNGWYYLSGSSYVRATETSPVSNRTYYEYRDYGEWSVDTDATGGLIPEEE